MQKFLWLRVRKITFSINFQHFSASKSNISNFVRKNQQFFLKYDSTAKIFLSANVFFPARFEKFVSYLQKYMKLMMNATRLMNFKHWQYQYIIILMIHKNSHKTNTQKCGYRSNLMHTQPQFSNKHLFHYGSLHSLPNFTRQQIQQKQVKESHFYKPISLIRRASDDQYRRFNSQASFIYQDKSCYFQEEYDKRIKISTDQRSQQKSSIGSKGSRGSTQNQFSKPIVNLKETTSTTSAETMSGSKKQLPAFLKTKSKALLNKKITDTRLDKQGFRIIKKLGEGKFGKVFLAVQLATGFILAMKVVQKKKVISDGLLDQFVRQLKIQTFLRHPNIIEVYGFFEDEKYFYTLMQLGCDGQLYNIIQEKKKITEQGTSFIAKNLLQAVQHMHGLKILHRDIKPQNIVRIMGNVKICDFGWAANKMTKQQLRSTYCGTPLYLSPEILKGQKYDQKVDLWAIGVLAYQLLIGRSPFNINEHQDLYKIMTDQVAFPSDKKTSKEFQQFIYHILNKNPKERFTSSELLQLKFIRKYQGFQTCQQLCQ